MESSVCGINATSKLVLVTLATVKLTPSNTTEPLLMTHGAMWGGNTEPLSLATRDDGLHMHEFFNDSGNQCPHCAKGLPETQKSPTKT